MIFLMPYIAIVLAFTGAAIAWPDGVRRQFAFLGLHLLR